MANIYTKTPEHLIARADSRLWTAAGVITGLAGVAAVAYWATKKMAVPALLKIQSAAETDPGLIKKGTQYQRYETSSGHVYPRIRTFYNAHAKEKELPKDIPLLVFIHGLGGSIAQFAPLLTSLTQIAPCLAIDLPGCGLSDFKPGNIEAYTTTAFAELLFAAIDKYRNKEVDQKVVIVGHSMGCSVGALLASSTSPLSQLCSDIIISMVALCPRARALSEKDMLGIQRINYVPSRIFDAFRMLDRRGGAFSQSVSRVVGADADLETKKLQLRFNQQSKSEVFQKFTLALHKQEMETNGKGEESLLGKKIWGGLKVPLFLVAAESDRLSPPEELDRIVSWLTHGRNDIAPKPSDSNTNAHSKEAMSHDAATAHLANKGNADSLSVPSTAGDVGLAGEQLARMKTREIEISEEQGTSLAITEEDTSTKHSFALNRTVFPAPASHGLLYATAEIRILSGFIENFLAKYADQRLSPGWQLQHLTTSGKWDVKNLKKWQSIAPCSDPIAGVFRAMKTMREIDEEHCPKEFVKKYSYKVIPDGVAMVVDISYDIPVYNKNGLEEGGVEYHKFPTVSKLPPTSDEVEQFISLVESLRNSPKIKDAEADKPHPTVGVHCHYGFNRTGFFIVCHLVERLGWRLQDALDEFAKKRAPGIKHEYFVNELFVRYAVKMERRSTIVQ